MEAFARKLFSAPSPWLQRNDKVAQPTAAKQGPLDLVSVSIFTSFTLLGEVINGSPKFHYTYIPQQTSISIKATKYI